MDLRRVCTETLGFVTFGVQTRQPESRELRDLDLSVGLKNVTLCSCCSLRLESWTKKTGVATTFNFWITVQGVLSPQNFSTLC